MKKYTVLIIAICLLVNSCKKNEKSIVNKKSTSNYIIPLSTANTWKYKYSMFNFYGNVTSSNEFTMSCVASTEADGWFTLSSNPTGPISGTIKNLSEGSMLMYNPQNINGNTFLSFDHTFSILDSTFDGQDLYHFFHTYHAIYPDAYQINGYTTHLNRWYQLGVDSSGKRDTFTSRDYYFTEGIGIVKIDYYTYQDGKKLQNTTDLLSYNLD